MTDCSVRAASSVIVDFGSALVGVGRVAEGG